ncbi:MAG: ribonuclease P protein component [Chitinivibrionales bacterium]|nr:ribonuclease P protein component [Chitinivibrionales bacterium]
MRAGLPRARRIRGRKEIADILRSGKRWRCAEFMVIYRRSEAPYSRFAVLVSKRHGNAVVRNKIKRTYREVFRRALDDHRPPLDILFRPNYGRARLSRVAEIATRYEEWRKTLER